MPRNALQPRVNVPLLDGTARSADEVGSTLGGRVCLMDVQCERCKTEYEFDDALVSGRGTTVRCTNCGHQFKVRKQEVSEPGADRWVVRTSGGQELTFLTLRELQRAILAKQVGRTDVLRRGQTPARTLGTIAELEPFFEGRASSRPPPGNPASSIPVRLPPPAPVPRTPPPPPPDLQKRTASWGIPTEAAPPAVPPVRRKVDTLRPPAAAAAAPPPPPPMPPVQPVAVPLALAKTEAAAVQPTNPYVFSNRLPPTTSDEPATLRRPPPAPPPPPPLQTPLPAPVIDVSSPLPPPTVPVRRSYNDDDYPEMRRSLPSAASEDYAVPARRRVGGWVVAFVLLLAVGVVGWVVAKPYLAPKAVASTPQLDPRALGFVTDGERALADGNLDVAQEAFDKASALAERDPRVLVDEARVAAAKADVPWLKVRVLPPDAKDEARMAKADLDDRIARARKAADLAAAIAPEDPGAMRARVDSLRLAGERDSARREVSKIIGQASQPETAYVLAALDLAEPDPLWTTLIDRLRLAAAGEGNAGRARSALVYALAQSGDIAGARSELAKLDAMTRPYPLLHNLHAFVDRAPAKAATDGGVASNVPHMDVSSLPVQAPAPAGGAVAAAAPGGGGAEEPAVPSENGSAMRAAQAAIRKGDWDRARTIYEALVARNPGDSEALAGLGDVSRATGDTAGALSAYKRALAVNPSYLPALLGVADTQWASGDHASALRGYRDIVDRFPEGTYPAYVKTRVEGASAAPAPSAATTPAPGASAVPAPAPSKPPAPANSDGI